MKGWDLDLTLDSKHPPYARPSTTPSLVRIVESYQNSDKWQSWSLKRLLILKHW
jgi:hypothetical protein